MADTPNLITLLAEQNAMKESLLRSALLIGFDKEKGKRSDQFRRAILSVIIYGTNDGGYDVDTVRSVFNEKFHLKEQRDEIQRQINYLLRDGYVREAEGNKYVENSEDKKGQRFFAELEKSTNNLLEKIAGKVRRRCTLNERQRNIVVSNTKHALSAFFQMNALAMFELQDAESPKDNDAVIKLAKKGLDETIGKCLVSVLAYTIDAPDDDDKPVLEQWAKAVVAMRSTNIDPLLRNFKQQQLANKKFVLDTDVLLNLLCKNARYSQSYRKMVEHLVNAGSEVLVPDFVMDEVDQHAESARHKYSQEGSQCKEYTDEMLEGPRSNVFIEDYVKTIRKEPRKISMEFGTYLGNICSNNSRYVMKENIKKLIGEKNEANPYKLQENVLDAAKANELKDKIKEKAMDTPKGWGRSLEQLEEGALNDTRLYLTIRNENQDRERKELLGYQCYLLTRSGRTISCATELELYDKHVVCHPQSLISVLENIGQLDEVEVINLFDNPFLAYTATLIWDQVEPVIQAGAQIGYSDFVQLREKYDLQINEILTQNMAERQRLAEKYHRAGILFAKDWHDLFEEKEKTIQDLEQAKNRVDLLEKRNERLEKDNEYLRRKQHYYHKLDRFKNKKKLVKKLKKRK